MPTGTFRLLPTWTSTTAFVRRLRDEIEKDNVVNGAAALGFYLTLAIFPAMIFLMALIPYLPIERVDVAIMDVIREAMPARSAAVFSNVVDEVVSERRGGVLTLGLAAALWASSTGMYAVMQQINIAYGIVERRSFFRARATALGLTLLFAVLVLGAFSVVVLGDATYEWLRDRVGLVQDLPWLYRVFRWAIVVLALNTAIVLIYRFGPNRKRPLALVTVGSVTATALMVVGSLAFRVYVANFGNYGATYGSIGAVVVLMLWLFLTGLAMLVGAEIDALREQKAAASTAEAIRGAVA
jgi:membrane protein